MSCRLRAGQDAGVVRAGPRGAERPAPERAPLEDCCPARGDDRHLPGLAESELAPRHYKRRVRQLQDVALQHEHALCTVRAKRQGRCTDPAWDRPRLCLPLSAVQGRDPQVGAGRGGASIRRAVSESVVLFFSFLWYPIRHLCRRCTRLVPSFASRSRLVFFECVGDESSWRTASRACDCRVCVKSAARRRFTADERSWTDAVTWCNVDLSRRDDARLSFLPSAFLSLERDRSQRQPTLTPHGLAQTRNMPTKKIVKDSDQSGSSSGKAADQSSSSSSGRVLAVTAAEHHTGSALLELILSDPTYADAFGKVVGITFGEPVADARAVLDEYNVETLKADELDVETLKKLGVDTICLIPPPIKEKTKAVKQVLDLAKQVKTVQNLVLLSSAGCDYADAKKQPHLREFIDLEILAMAPKSDPSTEDTGHSPCIVRAGLYLENLLAYTKQAQGEGKLPIPIDKHHKFAPVALGDVVLLLAKILASKGPHGLGDDVRGQMITLTGPQMTAGPELAEAASQGLDAPLEFISVQEAVAKKVLSAASGSVVDLDSSELALVLEYYALVRAGATNYVAGQPTFKMVTGQEMELPSDWFKSYADSFKRKKRRTAKGE